MSDDDDYLSDKFLVEPNHEVTKTYSQLRKDAFKKAHQKNEQNRTKSKRQHEIEAREEGLNKSLFEKAEEEEQAGLGSGNKALAMMKKMGFTPGQSLGRQPEAPPPLGNPKPPTPSASPDTEEKDVKSLPTPRHKTEPLPINEWSGKKGIGIAKRPRSPGTSARIAKMARMEEESSHRSFRDRAREEYEERRAEGRLGPAQRTCSTLDEKAGKTFNVLWLDPNNPATFPSGLMEDLALHHNHEQYAQASKNGETVQERLRKQMQADALTALSDVEEEGGGAGMATGNEKKPVGLDQQDDSELLEEAVQFLRLQPQDRLQLVLSYLRTTYAYCFYCGTEYKNQEELSAECPGPEEDDHD